MGARRYWPIWAAAIPLALWATIRLLGLESGGPLVAAMLFTPLAAGRPRRPAEAGRSPSARRAQPAGADPVLRGEAAPCRLPLPAQPAVTRPWRTGVLAGDFNATLDQAELREIVDAGYGVDDLPGSDHRAIHAGLVLP